MVIVPTVINIVTTSRNFTSYNIFNIFTLFKSQLDKTTRLISVRRSGYEKKYYIDNDMIIN